MKVAIITDLHLGVRKNKDIFLESQIRFIEKEFVPYLKENNIKIIFCLGDWYDNRNNLNVMIKNESYRLLEEVFKDFQIYMIVGNHDSFYNSSIDVNSLKFFNKFENIEVIESIKTIEIDNKKICLVPWIVNNEKFIEEFEGNFDVVMGHFDITGSKMNKFKISETGINKSIFSNCKKVFSGHFHTRSTQKFGNTEIIYVGSPCQFDRGDMGEERGFIVLDLETLDYEFINNETSIKFIKLEYPVTFNEDEVKNNIVDVYIDTAENEFDEIKIEKYSAKLCNYGAVDYNIFVVNSKEQEESEFSLNQTNISSIEDMLKSYVDSLKLKNGDVVYNYLIELKNETKEGI